METQPLQNDKKQIEKTKAFPITITEKKHRFLPTGFYLASLIHIEEGIGKYKQPVLIFSFEIQEGKFKGEIVKDIINQTSNGERGPLWQLIKALSGKNLSVNEQMYLTELKHKHCYINIERGTSANGKTFDDIKEYVAVGEFADIKRCCPEP